MTNDPITKLSDIPQKDKLAADMLRALGRGTVTPALRKQFLEAFPRMEDRKFNLKGTITGRTQGEDLSKRGREDLTAPLTCVIIMNDR